MPRERLPTGPVPAKVGTIPMLIIFDGRGSAKLGSLIRFREASHGTKWEPAWLRELRPHIRLSR